MSYRFIDQDWETDASPFTLTGQMVRSLVNAMDGTDLRGGDGTAKDGTAAYVLADPHPSTGSRRALRLQAYMKFKLVTAPNGGDIFVMRFDGARNIGLRVTSGTSVLRWTDGTNTTVGSTALGTTAHQIDIDYREEHYGRHWVRVWLDGTLEIQQRLNVVSSVSELDALLVGVQAAGKCTWEAIWGRMKLWAAYDPQ